jgi:hypothetical protein
MKFHTKLNDAKVVIEYDEDQAADQNGSVNDCEVLYQGKNITQTVGHEKYWAYLIDCEAHYKSHLAKEADEDAVYQGQCRAERAAEDRVTA